MKVRQDFYVFCGTLLAAQLAWSVSVNPAAVTVTSNQPVITASGAGAQGVRWSLSPSIGSVSTTTSRAIYSPPASVAQVQVVSITATDIANPALTAVAVLTLNPSVKVTVSPATATIMGAGSQSFAAVVAGAASQAVTWSLTPSIGSISSAGIYSAAAVTVDTTVTIRATSNSTERVGTASVLVHPQSQIQFTTQANGLQTLTFGGVNYNYKYGEGLVTSLTSTNAAGQTSHSAPACSAIFDATSVTKTCPNGSAPVTVRVDFSTPDAGTITANVQFTNQSSTDTINFAQLSLLGIDTPLIDVATSRTLPVDATNPVSYVNFGSGQWAIWNNAPSPDVSLHIACGWTTLCKNQPEMTNILPGQTKNLSISVRFSNNASLSTVDLAPEAYAAFRQSYPAVVNWPDRRPIMAWFVADSSKRSAINPRGYLQQTNLDVSDIPNFSNQLMTQARNILAQMQARPVQPQGLLVWDLEGEEFIQSTTYVGDPRVLSQGYAPEMDAVADQMFALFKNAGYKVGITLRPQQLQWGTQLPATCQYDINNDYKDYFIKVDNSYNQKFFACYDPAGANWSLIPQGNGGQTFYHPNQPDKLLAMMMSKVAYAHARWGTTLYYVDTAVWHGGAPIPADTFRQLQLAFPDSLFIPEQSNLATMGSTLPFADPKNSSVPKFSPVTWRFAYPNGGLGVYLANCQGTCWTANYNNFITGQKIGDMPIYPQPIQMSSAQLQQIEAMILSARSQTSSIAVTDSSTGSSYSYQGAASTVYQYPVKMRVYFSDTPANSAASSTYCESGQWLGENTCSLNLSGLLTAQVRYYDYGGNLVLSQAPGPR